MKKCIALLMACIMMIGIAQAEGIDYASMTDEELHAVVESALTEIDKRDLAADIGEVAAEQEGVSIYFTGNKTMRNSKAMNLETVVVNESDATISLLPESVSVNGWVVFSVGFINIPAGKKLKDDLLISLEDSDATSIEEVKEIELNLYAYDEDRGERLGDTMAITLSFNGD